MLSGVALRSAQARLAWVPRSCRDMLRRHDRQDRRPVQQPRDLDEDSRRLSGEHPIPGGDGVQPQRARHPASQRFRARLLLAPLQRQHLDERRFPRTRTQQDHPR